MNSLSLWLTDSTTMLRRELKHQLRYPSVTFILIGLPVIIMLLFVYVFGGTLGNGLGVAGRGRHAYVNYVVPGMTLLAVVSVAQGTALAIAMDMAEGIIARFRTMAIARTSVLAGHVLGSLIQTALGIALVIGVGLLIGFRTSADVLDWLGAIGLLALLSLAITWLCVAIGLLARNPESASNLPMILILLPFLSSGFVPTDSMPSGLRWFAHNQPFTPIIETIRGLLMGAPTGHDGIIAVAWCLALTLVGFLWSRALFNRAPVR